MTQAQKQVTIATIEAEGARRPFSEIKGQWVRNGQGMMSQRHFAEILANRAARGY